MENTKSEATGKMQMPKLIKIPIVVTKKEANQNSGEKIEYFIIEARINPAYVMSYHPMAYGEDEKTATCVFVSGQCYWVNMPMEEFDKVMEGADRSYAIDIVEQ